MIPAPLTSQLSDRDHRRTLVYRGIVAAVVVIVFSILSRRYVVEDGLIYARFISNALAGHGLVFNIGEHVNALTSPLFTYILLATAWCLHGQILLAEHLIFTVTLIVACLVAEDLVPLSGILAATTAYFYTVIGLETTTFLMLLMLTAKALSVKRYDWLPLLVVLTMLARFEAGLLIPIIAWQLWRERSFPGLKSFLAPAALVLLYALLNHHWYGAYLPNSATSKFGQARSGFWGHWPWGFISIRNWSVGPSGMFRRTLALIPIIAAFSLVGWWRTRSTSWSNVLALFAVGLFGFYFLFNIPDYHWYYAPFFFLLILYGVRGMLETKATYALVFFAIAFSCLRNWEPVRSENLISDYVTMANWINQNTAQNASVDSVEIGTIGFFANRRVIDVLGLTEPKNAVHIEHGDASSWLNEDQPDYIIEHHPVWPWEQVAAHDPAYREAPFHSGSVYLLQRIAPKTAIGPAAEK